MKTATGFLNFTDMTYQRMSENLEYGSANSTDEVYDFNAPTCTVTGVKSRNVFLFLLFSKVVMYEEYADLPNFDPSRMDDPNYRLMVEQARQIKDNEDALKKSGQTIEQKDALRFKQEQQKAEPEPEPAKMTVIDKTAEQLTPLLEERKPSAPIHDQKESGSDFKMQDFIDQEKYDANSPIYKNLNAQSNKTGVSTPIESMWINKGQVKKYLASKNSFKIKEKGENRYRAYRFKGIGETELEQLQKMGEDLRLFYNLMALEGYITEDREGKERLALRRNGKDYFQMSKLQLDYRKKVAEMCLGISNQDFAELEMLSDPDFTVHDIWGLYDILDTILERAVSGSSYFRIASKTS